MIDVITIGRASVDLYGSQVGSRLEDIGSFDKYIGGSPTNIAAGAARLKLRSALITRVGDEAMGRFIREQLIREGVDVRGVKTDPERLTALVLLAIRDQEQFPLIFYRENCADMAICEEDIDPDLIQSARCVAVTGTHLSHVNTEAALVKALKLANGFGAKTALDIDFRPNLWGLSGHDDGDGRFIGSSEVTTKLQSTLHLFDLIVGTEEEFHIAGGTTNTIQALRNVRRISAATLVCKRGPLGASVFVDEIPDHLDEGLTDLGFKVEVFNVLGAGDGFMAGLLKGWLTDENWSVALSYANACGAIAVSRHGCTPAYPSWEELQYFLKTGVKNPALRKDQALEQIHWSTNRKSNWPDMRIFAFDHRMQFEVLAGATPAKIGQFKQLCLLAAQQVAEGKSGYGILCDGRLGKAALMQAEASGLWIGRPVEWPGSRPLTLEPEIGLDIGGLSEWPRDQVVKVLCFYHPDDDAATKADQEATISRLFAASRRNNLEFLLEIVPSKVGKCKADTSASIIQRFYDIGVHPDWWKLEPMLSDCAWFNTCKVISDNDPYCRGIVVLGLDVSKAELKASFAVASSYPLVKGFAVGRTIFAATAKSWLSGGLTDSQAVNDMAHNYRSLCDIWDDIRGGRNL
jgi:5-dehydro-2-deoxygluconokinase